jgi:hypothetical protein
MLMVTVRMNLNVNNSKHKIINNKMPMRLSRLRKWILTRAVEKPFEEGKAFATMMADFSPKAYYWIPRTAILHGYLDRRILNLDRNKKRSAEVVLTRSLETLEKNDLIIRCTKFHMNFLKAMEMNYAMRGKSEKEILEDSMDKDKKAELSSFVRIEGNENTKDIFLTDKGIEIRHLLLGKNENLG